MSGPPTFADRLVLVGYRGTGKTTVARELAQRWGWRAIDADERLEARAGRSIREIFATAGEAAFRDLEADLLADLLAETGCIVATGGGVVLREANRRRLSQAGPVVWLTADVDTILTRIAADATTNQRRPELTALGQAQEVATLLAQREPLYREVAGFVVSTVDRTPTEIAMAIESELFAR